MPNVIGQTLQQALASINGAHLRLLYVKFPVTSRARRGRSSSSHRSAAGTRRRTRRWSCYLGAFSG